MDEIGPSKELFDLINFDGAKAVQAEGEILEVYRPTFPCILCTLHCGNTLFSDIGKLNLEKNIIRGSKLVHQVFEKIPSLLCHFPKNCM